jgi:argininosuccinate lyase
VGRPIVYSEERLREILSPRYFVTVRRTPGGPAPEETARALDRSMAAVSADRAWTAGCRESLAAAQRELKARSAQL